MGSDLESAPKSHHYEFSKIWTSFHQEQTSKIFQSIITSLMNIHFIAQTGILWNRPRFYQLSVSCSGVQMISFFYFCIWRPFGDSRRQPWVSPVFYSKDLEVSKSIWLRVLKISLANLKIRGPLSKTRTPARHRGPRKQFLIWDTIDTIVGFQI